MDTLKLTYFDFPGGRAEPARLALHIGGIAFEDHRFAPAEFAQVCKHTPLHQVPVLHVNGLQVTQSDAITRYAGRLAGLYPEDPFQALLCDEVMGALEDLNIKVGATFGLGADELRSARGALVADALPRYLRWLDAQLEGRGANTSPTAVSPSPISRRSSWRAGCVPESSTTSPPGWSPAWLQGLRRTCNASAAFRPSHTTTLGWPGLSACQRCRTPSPQYRCRPWLIERSPAHSAEAGKGSRGLRPPRFRGRRYDRGTLRRRRCS